jgi:hypothetical protein
MVINEAPHQTLGLTQFRLIHLRLTRQGQECRTSKGVSLSGKVRTGALFHVVGVAAFGLYGLTLVIVVEPWAITEFPQQSDLKKSQGLLLGLVVFQLTERPLTEFKNPRAGILQGQELHDEFADIESAKHGTTAECWRRHQLLGADQNRRVASAGEG